jgi:hypothetical protein
MDYIVFEQSSPIITYKDPAAKTFVDLISSKRGGRSLHNLYVRILRMVDLIFLECAEPVVENEYSALCTVMNIVIVNCWISSAVHYEAR